MERNPGNPPVRTEREILRMDEALQTQLEIYLSRLQGLIQRGRQFLDVLGDASSAGAAHPDIRIWQNECGIVIHELSGGSKAHWLSRAFSDAFLLRSSGGQAVEGASPKEIVQRLAGVLEQAVASLSQNNEGAIVAASSQAPAPRRFDFVHNAELRPVLERAFIDSRNALEGGRSDEALRTTCGILEAIITDALEQKGPAELAAANAPPGSIADWTFETRLAVAERVGLVRSGWARLPTTARGYRDHDNNVSATSERDARQAGQVLHVVMRDLNPGR